MDALPDFRVLNPTTIDEVITARAAHPDSKPLGGGTDLVARCRNLADVDCGAARLPVRAYGAREGL